MELRLNDLRLFRSSENGPKRERNRSNMFGKKRQRRIYESEKNVDPGENLPKLWNFFLLKAYLSEARPSKLGFPLICAARMSPIASVIAVSVIVGPNRNIFFSKGSAK